MRFRLRRLLKVNIEGLMIAAGQNLKRLIKHHLGMLFSFLNFPSSCLNSLTNSDIFNSLQLLCDITPLRLFEEAQNISSLFRKIAAAGKFLPSNVPPSQVPQETQLQVINGIIGSALASSLRRNGWQIKTSPGEDLVFVKDSKELRPFHIFIQLVTGKPSREKWQSFCEENGIAQMPLGS